MKPFKRLLHSSSSFTSNMLKMLTYQLRTVRPRQAAEIPCRHPEMAAFSLGCGSVKRLSLYVKRLNRRAGETIQIAASSLGRGRLSLPRQANPTPLLSGPHTSVPSCLKKAYPQKALRGGIPSSFLEPFPRSWSHFSGNCSRKLTSLL